MKTRVAVILVFVLFQFHRERTVNLAQGRFGLSSSTWINVKFPFKRINTFSADRKGCTPITIPSGTFVPIFVLVRDRLTSLRISLDSFRSTIHTPYEIIVLDHHSSYPPMLTFLGELDRNGTEVHSLQSWDWKSALNEAADIIHAYLEKRADAQYYVFTDPDIAFLRNQPDMLLFYAALLKSCSDYKAVGPHLQISDIPVEHSTNSTSEKVLEHESYFWTSAVPHMGTWNGMGQHFVDAPIDTTFAMRRRNLKFARLQRPSARVHAPYAAVHTDWYFNSSDLPEDKIWYQTRLSNNGQVNHW